MARARWSSHINTGFSLGGGSLGGTQALYVGMFYSDFRSRLSAHTTSADDAHALASLAASHWADGDATGLLKPLIAPGLVASSSTLEDLLALGVISRTVTAVPAPSRSAIEAQLIVGA